MTPEKGFKIILLYKVGKVFSVNTREKFVLLICKHTNIEICSQYPCSLGETMGDLEYIYRKNLWKYSSKNYMSSTIHWINMQWSSRSVHIQTCSHHVSWTRTVHMYHKKGSTFSLNDWNIPINKNHKDTICQLNMQVSLYSVNSKVFHIMTLGLNLGHRQGLILHTENSAQEH